MEDSHHVAAFAFPFGNHGTPLINILRSLTSLASPKNKVHFSFISTPNSLKSLFPEGSRTDKDFPNIKSYEICDHKPEGYVSKGNILDEISFFLKTATSPGALKKVVEEAEQDVGAKVRCVIGDAFLWFLSDFAKEIEVPWVSCWVSGEHSLSVVVHTDDIRQRFGVQGIEGREEETMDNIPGLTKIRVKDLPEGTVTGVDSPFGKMLHSASQVLPQASAVCISSCEELDPDVITDLKAKLSKIFSVGPLTLVTRPQNVVDTYDCLGWLDKQRDNSVVYVSFGTACTPPPVELFALAEALQSSGLKFLWSIKDHLKRKWHGSPLGIDVLAHNAVGVFITHFGFNSMTESIAAEVPMIGRPFFGDHNLNGRLVEAVWEIGLQVEGGTFTKEGILKRLERILSSDEGKKMKENIKCLKELFGKAVAPNGSSIKNFKLLSELVLKA